MIKKLLLPTLVVLILIPGISVAKKPTYLGQKTTKGKSVEIIDTSYRQVTLVSSQTAEYTVESIPGLISVKVKPYRPWYSFGNGKDEATVKLSGLVSSKKYHVYQNQYSKHLELTADSNGVISFTSPTKNRNVTYILEKPSTITIRATGAGCTAPNFQWTLSTKTCKMLQNITNTIVIQDPGITLEGNGKTLTGTGGNNGISYDNSAGKVVIKNLTVTGFSRGISIDSSGAGSSITNVIATDNYTGIQIDSTPSLLISSANLHDNGRAGGLFDSFGSRGLQLDSDAVGTQVINSTLSASYYGVSLFYADNTLFRGNTIKNITAYGFSGIGGTGNKLYRNSFLNNVADVDTNFDGDILFDNGNAGDGGNYYDDTDINCIRNTTNSSVCRDNKLIIDRIWPLSNIVDNYPWACDKGWVTPCPGTVVPPGTGGGTVDFYTQVDSRWASNIYDHTDIATTTCASTTARNLTIKQCGCYITSVANMLKLTGFGTDSSGAEINPGTLNTWLKNTDGGYKNAYFNPSVINAFTKDQGRTSHLEFDESLNVDLEHTHADVWSKLTTSLTGGLSVIVEVPNKHFVLATEASGDTVKIMDPFWYLTTTLNATNTGTSIKNYNNLIKGIRIYKKVDSSVATKFLQFFLGSPVTIKVTDPLGRVLEYHPDTVGSYSHIPNTSSWTDQVVDPEYTGPINNDPAKFVYIPDVIDGVYTLELTGTGNGHYDLAVSGDVVPSLKDESNITFGQPVNYTITVSGGNPVALVRSSSTIPTSSQSNATICHRPPGNPSNAHTITVGQSAIRAHMAHGDTMGACSATTTATISSIKIPPGQMKKEINAAGGGFVPPGQAKKNKK